MSKEVQKDASTKRKLLKGKKSVSEKLEDGTLILAIGSVLSFNPWFWFFTWFLILMGIIDIYSSNASRKTKAKHIIIPLLIGFVLMLIFVNTAMENKFS